jgi:molybdenum cofactor biosynthesis enzyme MoaA
MLDNIKFRYETCRSEDGQYYKIDENIINLYIVVNGECNANCKFCEYRYKRERVDIEKFKAIYNKLLTICEIDKVHFTGGEPSLEIETIKEITKFIKDKNRNTFTSVNTNGVKIEELLDIETLDNISLSRHAIEDSNNMEIFGTDTVPDLSRLDKLDKKEKIHLSCNMINGYVDSKEKILNYLEMASELGINDVGIVSLMNINDYCNEHYMEFPNINDNLSDNLKLVRCLRNIKDDTNKICCKCENYLYRAKNKRFVSMYHRYALDNKSVADYLVYENNILKQGFSGEDLKI